MGVSLHLMPIRGQAGSIRWGYRVAAHLGPWTLTPDRGTPEMPAPLRRILRAAVLESDPMTLRQADLRMVVPRPKGALTWAVLELSLDADGRGLTALLGPYERQAI
jgi:hypothetical protein